jgi:hypothetical protein
VRTDYPDADVRWACARKKSYPDEKSAKRVATRLTEQNHSGSGRAGFEGVVVVAYACTRCGSWHTGRPSA